AQHAAVEAVLNSSSHHPFLLYGVTGSGKTEVYLTLTEKTLRAGKSVLMMVPEIALTSQISKRFIERFGVENIALWHSNLSVGEKTDTWRRIARGDLRIVIGARSSVFTPLVNLGMIMIDEEHDGSFKQDSPAPRYNAKVLAQELAKRTSAKIVYGSATPDPVSFEEAIREGQLLILPERFGGRPMASVELVDMKRERSAGNKTTLSRLLQEELVLNLERKEQTIILINRRGFFTLVTCTQCDYTFMCPQCSVALTVHKSKNLVRCHYCGFEESIPIFCPKCASDQLTQAGTGSQRVEQELLALLPEARILRLDSDVMQRKETYREVFEAFSAGEADVLVGTQMIAKGLDIPNVTLVGVISADSSFYLPDFKSSERGFQLLTQVAGRAGRGEKPGRVVVQSVDPNHAVIQFAKVQDYDGFYHYEMTSRKELNFPPFSQLFRFIVSAEEEYKASHFIKAMAMNLMAGLEKEGLDPTSIELLGPAPCVIGRIQGRFRFHCLLKNLTGETGHRFITQFYKSITPPEAINFLLDVEPQSLL
ncbi:MAG: primosomal protein N', partial [Cyanobacteria bacterium]|nr:primosomal protein N' [Cyanobacteriota bacterium]